MIMEDETSKPRRTKGIILVRVQRPETQQSQWYKSQPESESEGRTLMSQLEYNQVEEGNSFLFSLLLCSGLQQVR